MNALDKWRVMAGLAVLLTGTIPVEPYRGIETVRPVSSKGFTHRANPRGYYGPNGPKPCARRRRQMGVA